MVQLQGISMGYIGLAQLGERGQLGFQHSAVMPPLNEVAFATNKDKTSLNGDNVSLTLRGDEKIEGTIKVAADWPEFYNTFLGYHEVQANENYPGMKGFESRANRTTPIVGFGYIGEKIQESYRALDGQPRGQEKVYCTTVIYYAEIEVNDRLAKTKVPGEAPEANYTELKFTATQIPGSPDAIVYKTVTHPSLDQAKRYLLEQLNVQVRVEVDDGGEGQVFHVPAWMQDIPVADIINQIVDPQGQGRGVQNLVNLAGDVLNNINPFLGTGFRLVVNWLVPQPNQENAQENENNNNNQPPQNENPNENGEHNNDP